MKPVKTAFVALIALLVVACSHPLELHGNGDILSGTGNRNCYLADFQAGKKNCTENLVLTDYNEDYYAVPHSGWQFDHWENYCTDDTTGIQCSFHISAEYVKKLWWEVVPPLVAVFTEIPPPSFGGADRDGNLWFDSARSMADSGVITDTVSSTEDADFFAFTAPERANYTVSLAYENPDLRLYLYQNDADKTLLGESRVPGAKKQEITRTLLEKGQVYYFGVQAKSQRSEQEYRLSVSKVAASKPTHVGDLRLLDGLSHVIDYDITGQLYISNYTTANIINGDINSLWADTVYGLRIAGGRIRSAFAYGGTVEIVGGNIDVLDSEATRSTVSGGLIGKFYNLSSRWTISGGTFSGLVQVGGDGTGVFHIEGGDFQGGFKTNHIQGQNKNFVFYGDNLLLTLISVEDNEYVYRITGNLADDSPINQTISCFNFAYGSPPDSLPCDAVEIAPK